MIDNGYEEKIKHLEKKMWMDMRAIVQAYYNPSLGWIKIHEDGL